MELEYPTMKNDKLTQEINHLDKLGRSILLSLREIPSNHSISKKIKQKLLKAISKDNSYQLNQIIQKEVVRFDITIGSNGSNWNMLHFCAKSDAIKCIEFILKKQYQEASEDYCKLVNSRTIQGYTPLIIAIINRSNQALEKLLYFGGVDLHITDQHKMSPYEIALNYKNDQAIRYLMSYEALIKKKFYMNSLALEEPIVFSFQKTFCKSYMDAMVCCLTLGIFRPDIEDNFLKTGDKNSFVTHSNEYIDFVHIGSRKQLPGYDIDWQKASELTPGHKIPLYDSFNPFEIQQLNFTVKNHLMIFQCLSQQPWIIRKIIKPDKSKPNFYQVNLHPDWTFKRICIDQHIPYLKQRKQAMFLSDKSELWPMLLQKALAKHHGAYFALNSFSPSQILQELTGFPSLQVKIKDFENNKKLLQFLQNITSKNFLVLLKGRPNSGLNQSQNSVDCFSILNYYQTKDSNLLLINCPFIDESWKIKDKNQPLALKLIKGHYNTHNQMCVWIELEKIKQYFQSMILSFTFNNYERLEAKFKAKNIIFFKLRIECSKDDPTIFQLVHQDTQKVCDLSRMEVLKNQGQQQVSHSSPTLGVFPEIVEIQSRAGEYMCYIELDKYERQSLENFILLCYSTDCILPQFVEEQFAILEWFGYLKTFFIKITDKCVVQSVGGYSLILLKEEGVEKVRLRLYASEDQVIEGKIIDGQVIELINEGNIHFCIVKQVIDADKILFDYL